MEKERQKIKGKERKGKVLEQIVVVVSTVVIYKKEHYTIPFSLIMRDLEWDSSVLI